MTGLSPPNTLTSHLDVRYLYDVLIGQPLYPILEPNLVEQLLIPYHPGPIVPETPLGLLR